MVPRGDSVFSRANFPATPFAARLFTSELTARITEPERLTQRKSKRLFEGFVASSLESLC
jgi:hypothetical protein